MKTHISQNVRQCFMIIHRQLGILILFLVMLLNPVLICNAEQKILQADDFSELANAIPVNSNQELIDLLLVSRRNHVEKIIIYTNPSVVSVENETEGHLELNFEIYKHFHYGYTGGLSNAMDYSVASGPNLERFYIRKDNYLHPMLFYPDENNAGYGYYKIKFVYQNNHEELAMADAKIQEVLSNTVGMTDFEKVQYVYDYMKATLPKAKESTTGYPRNCNGIYGALFGDGTGYCCSTYASTIQRFMEHAGIPAYIIGGAYELGEEPCHGFNVMQIDGKWYATDYTINMCLAGEDVFRNHLDMADMIDHYMKGYKFAKRSYGLDKVKGLKVKNKKTRRLVVSWKAVDGAKGYQIQMAENKGFTRKKKTLTTSKLSIKKTKLKKGKTYYVRVRTYNTFNEDKMYGSWSKIKKIQIKK